MSFIAQICDAATVGSCRKPPTDRHDFNGDGKSDIAWRDSSGNAAVWLMNGAQVSQSLGVGNVSTAWSIVGTGDFDADGKGDVLWQDTNGNVAVWLMNDILWHDTSGNIAICL